MTPETLQQVADRAAELPPGPDRVARLREQWPQLHFSYCLDDEIGDFPVACEGADFNLYLVTGRHGCGQLTRDCESASGLVVADLE